jgi:tRNA(Ile)-lysidine synthase
LIGFYPWFVFVFDVALNLNFSLSAAKLVQPGERIGVAVSGGADSVALLRLLVETRAKLGMVLSVVHFNHQLRGADSDSDENFVRDLASQYGLPLYCAAGDANQTAAERQVSLETAARELRYEFFAGLLKSHVDKVATAHTMDDQAETVLMRLVRGAGTRGLAGIYPEQRDLRMIRPLLGFRRTEIEAYLKSVGQSWCEDATNADPRHTRNRIRHELLPLLARDYNPNIAEALARTADVARAEEEHWASEVRKLLPFVLREGKPVRGGGRAHSLNREFAVDIEALLRQPLALQRRLLRRAAEHLGISVDVMHVESALAVAKNEVKACELPGGWRLERSHRELRFIRPNAHGKL